MRTTTLLALSAALVFIAACGDDDNNTDLPYAVYRGEPNGDSALLQGTLELDNGCLYVEYNDGHYYMAFAENLAGWEAATSTLTMSGVSATVGDEVHFGGSDLGARIDEIDWLQEPGSGCDTEQIWMSGATMGLGLAASR